MYLRQHIIQPQLHASAALIQFVASVTAPYHLQYHTVTQSCFLLLKYAQEA
jgi:hypothetical protein